MKIKVISAVWCPSCLVMNKMWKKFKEEHPDIQIEKYDYDFDEDIVEKYNVGKKLPVTIFFDENDNELNRLEGEITYEEVIQNINN